MLHSYIINKNINKLPILKKKQKFPPLIIYIYINFSKPFLKIIEHINIIKILTNLKNKDYSQIDIIDIIRHRREMPGQTTKQQQKYIFTYKGIDYDASQFLTKHPGGAEFIQNMKNQRKDITQYFKSLHSEEAEKTLLSFKQVGESVTTKETKRYLKLYEKVKHLYEPNWVKEFCFISFVTLTFFTACFTKSALLSIVCFAIAQVVSGWLAHSMNHSRNKNLYKLGNTIGPLLGGFSAPWWGYKHNMHHMFTNSTKYDDDIKHEYYTPLYPFLYLKWRFDAFISSVKTFNIPDLICMAINYYFISRQKLIYFIVAMLVGGFYSANLLLGNHERQKRYKQAIPDDFISHQLVTCRNYPYEGLFWLTIMGGMQYQSEHHLFPQIPFYNLPEAKAIIAEELKTMGKEVTYGTVL